MAVGSAALASQPLEQTDSVSARKQTVKVRSSFCSAVRKPRSLGFLTLCSPPTGDAQRRASVPHRAQRGDDRDDHCRPPTYTHTHATNTRLNICILLTARVSPAVVGMVSQQQRLKSNIFTWDGWLLGGGGRRGEVFLMNGLS